MLLFVPFRSECNLLAENEYAEKTFACLVEADPDMYRDHDKLQQMLKANAKVKEINEARQEEATFSVDKENKDKGPQIVGIKEPVIWKTGLGKPVILALP